MQLSCIKNVIKIIEFVPFFVNSTFRANISLI